MRRLSAVMSLWAFAAFAQAPEPIRLPPGVGVPPPPGVPAAVTVTQPSNAPAMPAPAAPAAAGMTIPEPTSGLPAGRLIALPRMSDAQLREVALDLATHIEITAGYRRASRNEPGLAAIPQAVTADAVLVKEQGDARHWIRLGHVSPPRRLPQLWVQAYVGDPPQARPNPEGEPAVLDEALKMILAERSKIFARLRIADLASKTIPLGYVDTEAALFALRAMGYAVVTDSETVSRDDSYKGEDVDSLSLTRVPGAVPEARPPDAQQQQLQALPPDEQKRFLPRFPAIRNLPTTIALDRLPLVVKVPATEKTNMGLVGGEITPAQRDNLGLTLIPSAASPLSETVTGAPSELLIIYHPDYPEQFTKLKKVIDESIDRPARQVYVEAMVLEISQEGLKELGVQWDIKKGSQFFSIGSLIPIPPGGSAITMGRDSTLNVSPTVIQARIQALVQTNKAEVLSRPSLITLDNRQATIRVGTDIPVSTSRDAAAAGSGSNRVSFSFQYLPTGILLNVRPRISDDLTEISMLIDATVSSPVPGQDLQVLDPVTRIALASAPTISTRRVQTYARILDNQPLIIGGLLSRNQITTKGKVPLLGDIPIIGALFGHTSVTDDRREVIIVLTPSIVTENVRETKAQYPKDDDRFDQTDTVLFKEHYRIRAEDLIDSSDIRFNARLRAYKSLADRVVEKRPELAARQPYAQFIGSRIPAEFFFVTGMMYRMLDRTNAGDPIRVENLKYFESLGPDNQRPISVAQALARYGDGSDPMSFFERNPGKALALTFRFARASLAAADLFTETVPEVRLLDCPDRAVWRQMLWDLSRPDERGVQRYTILIKDRSDLRRLQLAYATQNTILNNGGVGAQIFDKFLVGRMLHLQEVSPHWERILNAQIAQYFFLGEHFYMHFIQEHGKAMREMDAALRSAEIAPLLEGARLPP